MDFTAPNNSTIVIPPVGQEARIGSVFNQIFTIIFKTELILSRNHEAAIWDFSQCQFLHPFYLGAIAFLKKQYVNKVIVEKVPKTIDRYLHLIYFHNPLRIEPEQNNSNLWNEYADKTYLPICIFNPFDKSSVVAQELIQNAIRNQSGFERPLHSAISLLLAELIDNITEHSKSKEGFLFCQTHPSKNCLYIMICDSGLSIYSSYATDDRYNRDLTCLESSALLMALSGKSTKDRPETENRGYGISKSRKLVVEGLHGEFFILSGSAFFRQDVNGEKVADLPEDFRWNGTAVLLKIPTKVPNNFDIYKYIS